MNIMPGDEIMDFTDMRSMNLLNDLNKQIYISYLVIYKFSLSCFKGTIKNENMCIKT